MVDHESLSLGLSPDSIHSLPWRIMLMGGLWTWYYKVTRPRRWLSVHHYRVAFLFSACIKPWAGVCGGLCGNFYDPLGSESLLSPYTSFISEVTGCLFPTFHLHPLDFCPCVMSSGFSVIWKTSLSFTYLLFPAISPLFLAFSVSSLWPFLQHNWVPTHTKRDMHDLKWIKGFIHLHPCHHLLPLLHPQILHLNNQLIQCLKKNHRSQGRRFPQEACLNHPTNWSLACTRTVRN